MKIRIIDSETILAASTLEGANDEVGTGGQKAKPNFGSNEEIVNGGYSINHDNAWTAWGADEN